MSSLLIIDSHPVQYRVPIYRELARLLREQGHALHVVYASDSSVRGAVDAGFGQAVTWDEPMLEGYDHSFLPKASSVNPGGFRNLLGHGIERVIRERRPDVIFLNGLNYLLFLRALIAARRLGIPVWLRSETQDHAFARSGWKSRLRRLVYRTAYSQVDHFFPIGNLNAEHYRAHGIADSRMTFCRYCVVDRFEGAPEELVARGAAKRAELGVPEGVQLVMFSGKLIPKKTPFVLIEALERMPLEERRKFALLYVGAGEQEQMLKGRAKSLGTQVIFAGFVNQGSIADFYLAADALILPSQQMGETWGLVANEAMMAGKPVILSQHAGSSRDFAGFTGVQVVEPEAGAVAEAFRTLPSQARGEAVRRQLAPYTIEAAAAAIQEKFQEQASRA